MLTNSTYLCRPRRWLIVAAALALVAVLSSSAAACPTCGSGMSEAGEAGQKMLSGWFWSIVFMMSMPFAIVTSLGGYMYWIVRKARRAQVIAIEARSAHAGERQTKLPTSVAPTSAS